MERVLNLSTGSLNKKDTFPPSRVWLHAIKFKHQADVRGMSSIPEDGRGPCASYRQAVPVCAASQGSLLTGGFTFHNFDLYGQLWLKQNK